MGSTTARGCAPPSRATVRRKWADAELAGEPLHGALCPPCPYRGGRYRGVDGLPWYAPTFPMIKGSRVETQMHLVHERIVGHVPSRPRQPPQAADPALLRCAAARPAPT
jgi:hypothetical protein